MENEKKYVNGIVIKEKTFDNGGTQLKMSIKVDDFIAELKAIEDKGWANLICSRRKEPSDTGITHYMKVDTWKPDPNKTIKTKVAASTGDDDLPF